jgi:tetratricopeptide (TPR) repeat protein
VGREACVRCHEKEDGLWRGSHHDLAMQRPDATTVLGNFENATFAYHGVTSTFFRKDGRFLVRTDGPDGKLHEYEIAYTFGVFPLQQYLIAFPGGRYQALNVCWDTRPAAEGGQRWFHLYPNENVDFRDVFHWTGPYQNWNFMCAECHSTNLQRGYHPEDDRYLTTFSEIDVSCEACHGPGSAHVSWGDAVKEGRAKGDDPRNGMVVSLKDPAQKASWDFDMKRGIAARSVARTSWTELVTCARCHARRSVVSGDYAYGKPLLDTHRPALLDEALYYADGQIEDEVYEYGSFLQSRMYRAGVTCSDCHDPHSLKVRVAPDTTCSACHLQERFATPSHHFHKPGSKGASCVECHMPARKYMVVHARRDHGFKVPRPDLSLSMGTPNACTRCHADHPVKWAADTAAKWWPGLAKRRQFAEALDAGRRSLPGAESRLVRLAGDTEETAIVRATAVSLLAARLSMASLPAVEAALKDPDPLLRMAGLAAMPALPPADRVRLAAPLLADPVLTVRIDAARPLAVVPPELLSAPQHAALEAALAEYRESQAVVADRAEGHANLGGLHAERGELEAAEREYRAAIRLNRWFAPAYVSLAEVMRLAGRETEAQRVLRAGIDVSPQSPDLYHALGLSLAREKRIAEALVPLERAADLGKADPRNAYVFAVALHDAGQGERALAALRKSHDAHPTDRDTLIALAMFSRERRDSAAALGYARKLVALDPRDREARALLAQIEAGKP